MTTSIRSEQQTIVWKRKPREQARNLAVDRSVYLKALGIAALAALGCSEPAPPTIEPTAQACIWLAESYVEAKSTFMVIEASGYDDSGFVEFDAANVYGTPMRHSMSCTFFNGEEGEDHELPPDMPQLRMASIDSHVFTAGEVAAGHRTIFMAWLDAQQKAREAER